MGAVADKLTLTFGRSAAVGAGPAPPASVAWWAVAAPVPAPKARAASVAASR